MKGSTKFKMNQTKSEFPKTKRKMPRKRPFRFGRKKSLPVAMNLLIALLVLLCCFQAIQGEQSKLSEPTGRSREARLFATSDTRQTGTPTRVVRAPPTSQEKDIATGQLNLKSKFDITSNSGTGIPGEAAALNGNSNQFEIAEGLTMEPPLPSPGGGGELEPEVGRPNNLANNKHQHQWPLKQLDRIKSESKVSALVGQNAILNCAVQFKDGIEKPFVVNWFKYPHKLPIYIWYAGYPPHIAQDYENRAFRLGQASLNLTRVRQSDQGLYECKIYYLDRRPEDKGNGSWIYLDVQAPPHFTQTPPAVSYVQPGDSLQLTCRAESTPSPILRWYKNKLPIDTDSGPFRLQASGPGQQVAPAAGSDKAFSSPGGNANQLDLFIDNIQAGHTTGDYSCLASNSEGSIETRSQVALAIPAVITTMPRNQTRLEGEKMELLCQAKALPSNITYRWLFNDRPLEQSKWFEARSVVRHDGTLVVHSIHRDDQGEYKCQATNGLLHRQTSGSGKSPKLPIYAEASAHLHVEFPARITYSPPVQYLPLGLSGVIRCFYQASPPVEFFTWTLNNQQFDPNVDPNVERLANGSLLIRQVSKQYEGKYRCTPFNKHGSAGSSAAMEVRVEEAPQFDLKPAEFYKATINGHVKIPCDAHGSPKPTVSWRRVLTASRPETLKNPPSPSGQRRRSSRFAGNGDGLLVVDEPAGDDDHQLYQTIKPPELQPQQQEQLINDAEQQQQQQQQQSGGNNNISMMMISAHEVASGTSQQQEEGQERTPNQEQSVIISYAKLPSDRSEFKQAHLFLHGLRKEDHGRYECVVENEVATLIASTMLYIEETTPHAPTNLRVDTKAWSAQLTWSPGYDGGFEQSFVVWYRQVVDRDLEEPSAEETSGLPRTTTQAAARGLLLAGSGPSSKQHVELADFNWKSINVQPSDSTTFTIQNLSQDTSYEFYVRARNIIGDGPGSQTVRTRTKRAITGAISSLEGPEQTAQMTTSGQDNGGPATSFPIPVASSPSEDEGDDNADRSHSSGVTLHPTVMGIIHLVDIATTGAPPADDNHQSVSVQPDGAQPAEGNSTNKVIRIYFPSGSNNTLSSNSKRSDSLNPLNSTQAPDEHSTTTQEPIDLSTAPQNVSMMKVAQGYVINWSAPQRLISGPSTVERFEQLTAAASQSGNGNAHLPPLSQLESVTGSSATGVSVQNNNNNKELQPAAYSVEFREKGSGWQTLATSRERSLLLKDLKPGSEYSFRVFAHASGGHRGSPTPEFKYSIPDNRRKPGSTQALSAGVVSGFLFFIACIVIAVCAVNMCNKRRRKRAEKAAYVMMACPVLESHHDMSALNSNSLMKNPNSNPTTQGGVSGLGSSDEPDASEGAGHLAGNLRLASARGSHPAGFSFKGTLSSLRLTAEARLASVLGRRLERKTQEGTDQSSRADNFEQVDIKYTENEPMPVDVNINDQLEPPETGEQINHRKLTTIEQSRIDDDYWIRTPSDRKWGTLTLAASKLAERRAHERQRQSQGAASIVGAGSPEVDSLAEELNHCHHHQQEQPHLHQHLGSQTLPRSFQVNSNTNRRFLHTFRQPGDDDGQVALWPTVQQPQVQTQLPPGANFTNNARMVFDQVAGPPVVPVRRFNNQISSTHQRSLSQVESSGWPHQQAQTNFNAMLLQSHFLSNQQLIWNQQQQQQDLKSDCFSSELTMMGKRNSFARSTLPMASAGTPTQMLCVGANYPPVSIDNYQLLQHHNSLAAAAEAQRLAYQRNTSNLLRPICSSLYTNNREKLLATKPDANQQVTLETRLKLPQIEPQFIITKPPELPPKTHLDRRRQKKLRNRDQLSEEEALERGHLFVRPLAGSANDDSVGCSNVTSGGFSPSLSSGVSRDPRGLPQAGQRSEQRRLRQQQQPIPVETINAKEKIESYLRHYESLVPRKRAPVFSGSSRNGFELELSDELEVSTESSETSNSGELPVDDQTELTFQPYYNLPSLKYTISLPLRETNEGRLVLEETSHLRRSRRSQMRRPRSRKSSLNIDTRVEKVNSSSRAARPKVRLGSSSSCPPPPVDRKTLPVTTEVSGSTRCSLESAMNKPTFGHPDILLNSSIAPDSLESSLTSVQRQEAKTRLAKRPAPNPPPIPPHRSTKMDQSSRKEEHQDLSRLNSLSSQQSSSSPSSSTSSNTIDQPTTSESHITDADHLVDENYEFDLISSCSSSNRKLQRNLNIGGKYQQVPYRRCGKEELYSKIVRKSEDQAPKLAPKQTARFYTNNCAKEQALVGGNVRRIPANDSDATITPTDDVNDDHYDTVCLEDVKWQTPG